MEYHSIKILENNGIAFLIFNDPEKKNAFSPNMVREIVDALNKLRYEENTKVIILRGAGGDFCGGADVKAMAQKAEKLEKEIPLDEDPRINMDCLNQIISLIREIEKPVIAWLEGAVAGAGMSVAMACDFSFADENSKMLFAFVNMGLVPDMGASKMLTSRVGFARATDLFMTGRRFSGRQAADWGIITEAYPAEILEEKVMKMAERLSQGPSMAYDRIKKMLNRIVYSSLNEVMINEMEYQRQLNTTQDHLEAIKAFLEKRPPVFSGK